MKRCINSGVCILLVVMFLLPVFGDSLSSNGDGTASGSTSVTARVVISEETPQEDVANEGESSKTGDTSRPYIYACIMIGSITAVAVLLKQRAKSN